LPPAPIGEFYFITFLEYAAKDSAVQECDARVASQTDEAWLKIIVAFFCLILAQGK